MNYIKRWLLTKLGIICPKCCGKIQVRFPCSHGWGRIYCEHFPTCDYGYAYKVPSPYDDEDPKKIFDPYLLFDTSVVKMSDPLSCNRTCPYCGNQVILHRLSKSKIILYCLKCGHLSVAPREE